MNYRFTVHFSTSFSTTKDLLPVLPSGACRFCQLFWFSVIRSSLILGTFACRIRCYRHAVIAVAVCARFPPKVHDGSASNLLPRRIKATSSGFGAEGHPHAGTRWSERHCFLLQVPVVYDASAVTS